MPNPTTILVQREGRILTITLNRPEKLNAYNQEMKDELREAWREVRDDPDIWCAIVTGAGRAFSSGADVASLDEKKFKKDRKAGVVYRQVSTAVYRVYSMTVYLNKGSFKGLVCLLQFRTLCSFH